MHKEFSHLQPLFIERVFRNINGAKVWCDVVQSSRIETCPEMARLSLLDALASLRTAYSRDIQTLRWGEAHQAAHDHPELGKVPFLRWFVNLSLIHI